MDKATTVHTTRAVMARVTTAPTIKVVMDKATTVHTTRAVMARVIIALTIKVVTDKAIPGAIRIHTVRAADKVRAADHKTTAAVITREAMIAITMTARMAEAIVIQETTGGMIRKEVTAHAIRMAVEDLPAAMDKMNMAAREEAHPVKEEDTIILIHRIPDRIITEGNTADTEIMIAAAVAEEAMGEADHPAGK
jgi:hypothetical protein